MFLKRKSFSFWCLLALLVMSYTSVSCEGAQTLSSEISVSGDSFDRGNNDMRIEELNRAIEGLASVPVSESAARFGVSEVEIEDRITSLSSLQNLYRRLNVAVEKTAGLKSEVEKRRSEQGQSMVSLEEKPPFNLSYYDGYLQRVEDLNGSRATLSESISREQKAILSAQSRLETAEKDLRMARSDADSAKGTEGETLTQWHLRRYMIREELWRVTLAFLRKNLENLDLQKTVADLRLGQAEAIRRYIHDNLAYDKKDLDDGSARYALQEEELKKKVASLLKDIDSAEKAYADAHANLNAASGESSVKAAQMAFSEAEIEREFLHLSASQTQEMVGIVAEMREMWTWRYALLREKSVSADVLIKAREEMGKRIGKFDDVLMAQQRYQSSLHGRALALDKEMEDGQKDKAELSSLRKRRKLLDRIMSQNMDYMGLGMSLDTMNRRFLEEIKSRISTVDVAEKVTSIWRTKTAEILNTELWHSGDYTVRLKSFVLALFILSMGLMASRKVAKSIRKWLLLHSKRVDVTGVHAIERLLYYVLTIGSFLIALKIVNVPLTAFAFLGGAIAIGVGFGAQNLFNNLISGFILMVQQPFKINDIVQIEDITATVLEIDSRSTKIRTFDNYDVLVPNKYFLDNRIINWTLSDKIIRGKLDIGVAYGTKARRVEEILLNLAKDHPLVIPNPSPYVLFSDYGDSSMKFTLYFWVDTRNVFPSTVASDMRYMIQEIFEKEGIEIPFPQMDVRLRGDGASSEL